MEAGLVPRTVDDARQAMERQAQKMRIGASVARAIANGASLFMNTGSTTEAVARALLHHRDLYVVTNNLNIAAILSANPECQVVIAGGLVRSSDRGIVGDSAVDLMQQFRVDIGIIGIRGIDADGSLFDADYREVSVARTILTHSRKVFLVADRSKFERSGMVRLGTVDDVDALFTDQAPPTAIRKRLTVAGVDLHIAGEGATQTA